MCPGLSDPGADWSNGECQPEKKMRRAGEPLRHRIEKNQRQRYGREDAGQPINCCTRLAETRQKLRISKTTADNFGTSKCREAVRGLR